MMNKHEYNKRAKRINKMEITTIIITKQRIIKPKEKVDKLNVTIYRPVSILCLVSKILERAIYTQVEQHLKNKTKTSYTNTSQGLGNHIPQTHV